MFCADVRVNVESQPFCVGTRIKLGCSFSLFYQHLSAKFGIVAIAMETWETATMGLAPPEPFTHSLGRFIHSLINL